MAISTENRKRKLLALFLSLMMVSSTAASLAACDDTTDDSTDSDTTTETTETDDSRINNGSFEYLDRSNGTKLILTSPTGWGSPSTGSDPTSKAASGIVDTAEDAWKNLTESNLLESEVPTKKEDITEELWAKMSAYDKLKFYEAWDDADYDEDVDDQDFYDSKTDNFNIDEEDVPTCANPGTHDNDSEKTNVLMIHNKNTNGAGTSQKYTSSSTITLAAGTSAEFSLWVKTQDLTFNDGNNVIAERGAYIGVTQSIGGKTLDQFQVKNINTELLDESETENGWVKYEFFLKGSSFASTTFNIVLGLGQSVGANTNHFEYVEGYAFFDDVTCKVITNDEFDAAVKDSAGNYTVPVADLSMEGDAKKFRFDTAYRANRKFAIDLYADFEEYAISGVTSAYTEEVKKGVTYIAANDATVTDKEVYYTLGEGFSTQGDVATLSNYTDLKTTATTNSYLNSALNAAFGASGEKYPFDAGSPVLMLLSAHGVNYTSTLKDATTFTLDKGESLAFSFFMKTSDMQGVTGANVTVVDGQNKTVLSMLDTTNVTAVDTDDTDDIHKGWQQCFFFVTNDTEKDGLTFHVEFSIGTSTIYGSTKDNYIEGYAAFAGFQVAKWTDGEYDYATSGTYAKTVALVDADKEEYPTGKFDTPAYVPENAIEYGIANPKNYRGVKSGSGFVNGNIGADSELNALYTNAYAGLISKEYVSNYLEEAAKGDSAYWMNAMNITTEDELNALFGNSTQPLLIYNNEGAPTSYGFIAASSSTLAANNYATVSVRVKANGATAYVYLTDMSDETRLSSLSVGRQVSYWYDEDGNICASDPTDEHFSAKTGVAFYRQANGLFLVNKNWAGSTGIDATQYYANLANYEEKDGNLIVAEGGVSYDYNKKYDNEGLDGIAFYGKDGKYYADPAYTVAVADFATVSALTPRYTAAESQDLCVTVPDTAGEWITVTFYLATGSQAKNYRLEVWNGARNATTDSEKAPAGSYVMFDTNTTDSLSADNWTNWTNEAIDNIIEANGYEDIDDFKAKYEGVIYNTFSFFDSASFLRYNAEIDENEIGNYYDDYDPTIEAEGISYLLYKKANKTEIFVSYLQDDVTVAIDEEIVEEEDTTTDEDETTDGTNLALLIPSIIVAAVLLLTLALIVARKIIKWSKKKQAQKAASATPKAKAVKAPKAPKKVEKHEDENDPYND